VNRTLDLPSHGRHSQHRSRMNVWCILSPK
jgi:hypothetical protein